MQPNRSREACTSELQADTRTRYQSARHEFPMDTYRHRDKLASLINEVSHQCPANLSVTIESDRIDNENVHQFYHDNRVDWFMLMSETEGGVPVSICEAMSHGVPVIAASSGAIPEIVDSSIWDCCCRTTLTTTNFSRLSTDSSAAEKPREHCASMRVNVGATVSTRSNFA